MTKNQLTREENVQAVFDLKAGYTLGLADVEILKRVARMALAALDSEPVAYTDERNLGYIDRGRETAYLWGKQNSEAGDVPLYRHAQPAPELKPVGYLFVSDQGAIAYSPTDWGMPGFRLAGQIYGDIDVESQPVPVVLDSGREQFEEWFKFHDDGENSTEKLQRTNGGANYLYPDVDLAWIVWKDSRSAMLQAAPVHPFPDNGHKWSYGLIHPENCQCFECRSSRLSGGKS